MLDFDQLVGVQSDATNVAAGAVLFQRREGMEFPVAYASPKLHLLERAYFTIVKECLAIKWAEEVF